MQQRPITTHDLWKAFAIVTMVVDHIGYFFFPSAMWWRVIGRASAPVWFFLVGYTAAKSPHKPLPWIWLVFGGALNAAELLITNGLIPLLPLCVLFTLFFARFAVPIVWPLIRDHRAAFLTVPLACLTFGWMTDKIVEYGTFGLMASLCGAMVADGRVPHRVYMPVIGAAYGATMIPRFGFDAQQAAASVALCAAVFYGLSLFTPRTFASPDAKPYAAFLRFCGRYSLEFYVAHLLVLVTLFRIVAM